MRTLRFFLLSTVILYLFVTPACFRDDEVNDRSIYTLKPVRTHSNLPLGLYSTGRLFGTDLWFNNGDKLVVVSCTDSASSTINIPAAVEVTNSTCYDQPFVGTDQTNLLVFDYAAKQWQTVFTCPDSQVIYLNEAIKFQMGHIAFLTRSNIDFKAQYVHLYKQETGAVQTLDSVNQYLINEKLTIINDPQIIRSNTSGDSLLLLMVNHPSATTNFTLLFDLTTQQFIVSYPFGTAYYPLGVVQDKVLMSAPNFWADPYQLFDPQTGALLWTYYLVDYQVFDESIFARRTGKSPSILPIQPGELHINLRKGTLVSSIAAAYENHYAGIKADDNGVPNTLVLMNKNNGKLALQETLPNRRGLVPPVFIYPDSNFLIVRDSFSRMHFLKIEKL